MAWNDFLKSPQMQGGAPGILNYGIDTLANKFNNYAGSNQRLDYDEGLSDWGSPMGNVPDAPSMPPMLDQTGQMGASNYRAPQTYSYTGEYGGMPPEDVRGYDFKRPENCVADRKHRHQGWSLSGPELEAGNI